MRRSPSPNLKQVLLSTLTEVEKEFGENDPGVVELKRILLCRIADLESADSLNDDADPMNNPENQLSS
jgi:hypothetical protein